MKLYSVNDVVSLLRQGDVVGIPTETVYGLAADISQPKAVEKIFTTKKRPFFDPLIVHISKLTQLESVVEDAVALPPLIKKLADEFWPGPLTMILPKNKKLNSMITSGLETVGVRMPKHPLALQLISELGQPVAAPSANRFGHTSPTCAEHVVSELGELIPVLDGGPCEIGVESTVIGFNSDYSEIKIYRPGAITQAMLKKIAPTETAKSIKNLLNTTSSLNASPGQLEHHYMPDIPLIVFSSISHLSIEVYEKICITLQLEFLRPHWVTLADDPTLAARQLYARLREGSQQNEINCLLLRRSIKNAIEIIKTETADLEYAIADRLTKAATLVL